MLPTIARKGLACTCAKECPYPAQMPLLDHLFLQVGGLHSRHPMRTSCDFSVRILRSVSRALVYFVAEKMSSNLSFRTLPSARGQLDSSWCTKMTFSSTACAEGGQRRLIYYKHAAVQEARIKQGYEQHSLQLNSCIGLILGQPDRWPATQKQEGIRSCTHTHTHSHTHTLLTPIREGTILSMSTHRYVTACFSPVTGSIVCSTESRVLNCRVVFFSVSCRWAWEM